MRGWSLEALAIVLLGLSTELVKLLLIDWRDRNLLLLGDDRIGVLRSLLLLCVIHHLLLAELLLLGCFLLNLASLKVLILLLVLVLLY
jgi:hypothetical protein